MLRPRSIRRKHIHIFLSSFCILLGLWWITCGFGDSPDVLSHERLTRHGIQKHHPIDNLINEAQQLQDDRLSHQITSLHGAVYTYRQRRRRHPPPGYEKWYARAVSSQAVIVESFFDQIYEDLEPFWGVEPASIRGALTDWTWTLRIRNGKIKDVPQGRFRSRVWGEMITQIAADLPDMDIAINPLDEPRTFVPFLQVDAMMKRASQQRQRMMSLPANQILTRPSEWIANISASAAKQKWITKGALLPHILDTCPPADEMQSNETEVDHGISTYTANWTATKDLCANRRWGKMHGSLIKPGTMEIRTELLPIFSAAKLQGSNDVLLPPPSYYTSDPLFTGRGWFGDGKTSTPWRRKLNGLVWRGKATGGVIHQSTVETSHRQRLVTMLNASHVFPLLDQDSVMAQHPIGLSENDPAALSHWLQSAADAGFTDTLCPTSDNTKACQTMHHRFRTVNPIAMKKQYGWKYLPDIDGNSLSGRFRAFLTSNSSPMKATLFKEWHDHRLIPWAHFIPLDITLRDLWSTMAYFLGSPGNPAHDLEGETIAEDGRLWAENVMRKEDMLLYVHRVLLEYGRICDDDRDRLGFTDDLRAG